MDDLQWDIIRWNKSNWKEEERLTYNHLKKDSTIQKILWNYDEASKNTENVRIFMTGNYLVMERGNLFHSLYDLVNQKVIINEVSPWSASNFKEGEEMNEWIELNIHSKIKPFLVE
jgi:hypothetical protein